MKNQTYILSLILSMLLISCSNKEEIVSPNNLQRLLDGNLRFSKMKLQHPHESMQRISEISAGQHPFAVIVCCSDSRVPPELLFDQGLGDLFVIRTAGNIIGGIETGSIEYAVEHLGVKLVMVMGHESCGAVKAFVDGGEAPGHIGDIIDSLKAEEEIQKVPGNDKDRLNDCIIANIKHGAHQLSLHSSILEEKIKKGELEVICARYDLHTGVVRIIR